MIRVLLSAPLCLHIRLSSRFTSWPDIWIVPVRHCVEPTHLRLLTHQQNVIHIKAFMEKRHQRLRTFIDAYPQADIFPVLITSTRLKELWECGRHRNMRERP